MGRVKTNFFAKDMRVIKDIYRKHFDEIVWNTPENIDETERGPNRKIIKFKNDKENQR